MKNIMLLIVVCLCANSYAQEKMVMIKGCPFSMRRTISLEEDGIDSINDLEKNPLLFFHTLKSQSQIKKLQLCLKESVKMNPILTNDYDLRMGIYFGKEKSSEKYYFDQYQRLIFKRKVYQLDSKRLKTIFSLICKPKFVSSLNSLRESHYWKYSPQCD
jgi:hypothetical protein